MSDLSGKSRFAKAQRIRGWTIVLGMLWVAVFAAFAVKSVGASDAIAIVDTNGGLQFPGETHDLYNQLHWLWLTLECVPGVYIGAAGIRASYFCGAIVYSVGDVAGWWMAARKAWPYDPTPHASFFAHELILRYAVTIVMGVLLVALGRIFRMGVRRAVLRFCP